MKDLAIPFVALTLLAGCTNPTRAEATIVGDTGKYMGFPLCIEVTYQNEETLAIYPKDACSPSPLAGPFKVVLGNQADDPDVEVVNGFGQVYLRGNVGEPFYGSETSRSEAVSGDTATIEINVSF
ncbi:MAG: hypothetical protein FJ096_16895 [Deltaproteobacteria bacterium]|nr:hypothetical protein [Deltaproteobacteria bacterium]